VLGNHGRIFAFRDRIRIDPAPFVYAQLAEEYRRARDVDQAVTCCRECLARFPAYLSIRVILGRALAERGELDAAALEFERVLADAPDNLTATRDLAEIELRRGRLEQALHHYRRAPAAAPAGIAAPPSAAADFDAILESLGVTDEPLPPLMEMLLAPAASGPRTVPAATRPARPARAAAAAIAGLEAWLAAVRKQRIARSLQRDANRSA
jgi:tetratricopeptide (TPR) repeat protein